MGMRKSIVVEALQSISCKCNFYCALVSVTLDGDLMVTFVSSCLIKWFFSAYCFFLIYQMHFTTHGLQSSACWIVSHWMKQMIFICLLFEKSTLNRIKFPILDPILEKKRVGAESQTRGGSIAHDLYSRKKGR